MNKTELVKVNTNDGQATRTINSREVAEMTGMRHSDLLEKIGGSKKVKGYITHLTNGKFRSSDFFTESTYVDAKGETRHCYEITRKGCDMVANKMIGEKGILFTAAYVTRFEEMEQLVKDKSTMSYKDVLLKDIQSGNNSKIS